MGKKNLNRALYANTEEQIDELNRQRLLVENWTKCMLDSEKVPCPERPPDHEAATPSNRAVQSNIINYLALQ